MPSPFTPGDKVMFEANAFMAAVKKHPGKMVFFAGGDTLNPMIQKAAVSGASPEMQRQFREQAEKLLSEGAVGFGEISVRDMFLPPPRQQYVTSSKGRNTSINDSGGARVQEGIDSLAGYASVFYNNTLLWGTVFAIFPLSAVPAQGARLTVRR